MIRLKFLAFLLLAAGAMPDAYCQDKAALERWQKRLDEQGPKPLLKRGAWFYGYPGGMAFHTAFHFGITTRYLLLKTATELPEVRDYLGLDAEQIGVISRLQALKLDATQAKALADPNAEPDEHVVDPDYFRFLSGEQLSRLDLLTFWFDGYPFLSRSSVANRVELSPETRTKVASILLENREDIYLPYVRANFAAKLPPNHKYRDSELFGRFSAGLNHEIVDVLEPSEITRMFEWLTSEPRPDEAAKAIKQIAPLPDGFDALVGRWHPFQQKKEAEQ
jgi:hypothetical protein